MISAKKNHSLPGSALAQCGGECRGSGGRQAGALCKLRTAFRSVTHDHRSVCPTWALWSEDSKWAFPVGIKGTRFICHPRV